MINVEYPGLRYGLILEMKDLSDFEMQKTKWANPKYKHAFSDDMGDSIGHLEDDGLFPLVPEVQIGVRLRNQLEADAIKSVVKALLIVTDKLNYDQPDSVYLNSPLWQDVVKTAKHAYEVMMEDEDLDRLLEQESKR